MSFEEIIRNVTREILSREDFAQLVEARVISACRDYRRSARAANPPASVQRGTRRASPQLLALEPDAEVIARHRAACADTVGSGGGLCAMCKKLSNENRMDFLVRLYRNAKASDFAGLSVSRVQDGSRLNPPTTGEYLRQLWELKLVRRVRVGREVNYFPDYAQATPPVAEIAAMIAERACTSSADFGFAAIFRVMMGESRARIVRHLAAGGEGVVRALCDKFDVWDFNLHRVLHPAVEAGVLSIDAVRADGTYRYLTPADPIARRVVELS